jgi:hypothetical protein
MRAEPCAGKTMSHRFIRPLTWFAFGCSILVGCTKLEDPNEVFGDAPSAGSAGMNAGGAGSGGDLLSSGTGGALAGSSAAGSSGPAGAAGNNPNNDDDGGSAGEAGAPNMSCNDPTGFQGLGCGRCAGMDIFSLENACTDATCTPFDNGLRLTKLGAGGVLPSLPVASGGAGGTGGSGGAGGAAGTSGSVGAGGSGGTNGGAGGTSGVAGKACADLASKGTIVYITGSSAAKPFLQQIAQQLVAQNVYIVYASTGSCIGVDAVVNGTPITTGPAAAAATATYWDSASSNGVACDLPNEGVPADIGASDVFAQSCPTFELANLDSLQIRDAHGPIQTMTFVVPANSHSYEISAQAAYFVFGFGATGGVQDASGAPLWNNEKYLYQRSASSGTQAMLASAIGVPATKWRGQPHKSSDDVASDIQMAGQKQDTGDLAIGILAADYIDSKNLRAQIRVLGFQDSAQHCALFPDSTSTAHDKRNVRDGHYPVWGPLHLLLKVDHSGNPVNPANRQAITDIVGYLSGTKLLPNGSKLLDVYAQNGLVPECAMHVSRTKDGGNIVPFTPENPCSCLFDKSTTGSTTCKPCGVQGDCSAGQSCSQGYCEG